MSIIIRWFAEHILGLDFLVMSLFLPVCDILTTVRFRLKFQDYMKIITYIDIYFLK